MATATIGDIYKPPFGRDYRERDGDDHDFRGISLLELEQRARNDAATLFVEHAGLHNMRATEAASSVSKLALQGEPALVLVFTDLNENSGEGRAA